jgi:hypothetical protein
LREYVKNGSGLPASAKLNEPGNYPQDKSALFFTGKGRKVVRAGGCLAFFNAGLTGNKFRAGDQVAAGIAAGILPALIADPVLHGTDLGSVHTAGKVKPVTGSKSAG